MTITSSIDKIAAKPYAKAIKKETASNSKLATAYRRMDPSPEILHTNQDTKLIVRIPIANFPLPPICYSKIITIL